MSDESPRDEFIRLRTELGMSQAAVGRLFGVQRKAIWLREAGQVAVKPAELMALRTRRRRGKREAKTAP